MEYIFCTTCGSQLQKSIDFTHKLTNRHLAASGEYYCQ